jgi:hypothetical protein
LRKSSTPGVGLLGTGVHHWARLAAGARQRANSSVLISWSSTRWSLRDTVPTLSVSPTLSARSGVKGIAKRPWWLAVGCRLKYYIRDDLSLSFLTISAHKQTIPQLQQQDQPINHLSTSDSKLSISRCNLHTSLLTTYFIPKSTFLSRCLQQLKPEREAASTAFPAPWDWRLHLSRERLR